MMTALPAFFLVLGGFVAGVVVTFGVSLAHVHRMTAGRHRVPAKVLNRQGDGL